MKRHRAEYMREYRKRLAESAPRKLRVKDVFRPTAGIDGEGYGEGMSHRYRYMAIVGEDGKTISQVENRYGLSSVQCLDAVLRVPKETLLFGFSLGYDMTFWFRDMPDELLWKLLRPEKRQSSKGVTLPVRWWPDGEAFGYNLNLLQGRLDISRVAKGQHNPKCKVYHTRSCANPLCRGIKRTIYTHGLSWDVGCRTAPCKGCLVQGRKRLWDFFRFFQSSFLAACESWEVVSSAERKKLEEFKGMRGLDEFRERWTEVKDYCQLECHKAALLARKLISAHNEAELRLKSYYGAGSTGEAMLDGMNARDYMMFRKNEKEYDWRVPHPDTVDGDYKHLLLAIATAFFGGRFENSKVGPIRAPVYSADIASAYPYQFAQLPCLVHGRWRFIPHPTLADIERSVTAVVNYRLPLTSDIKLHRSTRSLHLVALREHRVSYQSWGPFPFRHMDGTITFPVTSGGGWVWKSEYLAGLRFADNVQALGAWVYSTECGCEVFRKRMPEYYRLRVNWGKEGKGIVVKLGCNSCPGKTAQSKGVKWTKALEKKGAKFQNFVWAGMTNAGTRAQLLDAMRYSPVDVLSVATDGIMGLLPFKNYNALAQPIDTGTFGLVGRKKDGTPEPKPALGEWELREKPFDGIMLIRPGMLFPLGYVSEEEKKKMIKEYKARGVGKANIIREMDAIMAHWEKFPLQSLSLTRPIFFGMRACLREKGKDTGRISRDAKYGTWTEQPIKVGYLPLPKRPMIDTDKETVLTWAFDTTMRSASYNPAVKPIHIQFLEEEAKMLLDQPDVEGGEDTAEWWDT